MEILKKIRYPLYLFLAVLFVILLMTEYASALVFENETNTGYELELIDSGTQSFGTDLVLPAGELNSITLRTKWEDFGDYCEESTENFSLVISIDSTEYTSTNTANYNASYEYNEFVFSGTHESSDIDYIRIETENAGSCKIFSEAKYFSVIPTNNYSADNHYQIAFQLDYGPAGMSFILPQMYGSYKSTEYFHWRGECPISGTDRIILSGYQFSEAWTDEDYTIDCGEDLYWDYYGPIGGSSMFATDKYYATASTTDYSAYVQYTLDDPLLDMFYLTLLYPESSNEWNYMSVQPSDNFPIKFGYTILAGQDLSDVEIHFNQCTDVSYSSCLTEIDSDTLDNLDPQGLGFVTATTSIADGVREYFQAQLISTSTVFTLDFSLEGDTTSGIAAVLPENEDLGYWGNLIRYLFVPKQSALRTLYDDFENHMSKKIPVSYYLEVRALYNSIQANTTSSAITINLPDGKNGEYQATFFDTSEATATEIFDYTIPIMRVLLWFGFAIFVYKKGLNLVK